MGVADSVQATAFVAAACRAEIDPFAHLFAAELDSSQLALVASGNAEVVARTKLIDLMLLEVLKRESGWSVVNLGAGLCTRPYRLDLSGCREVIELDMPEILQTKERILAGYQASCPVRRIPADIRQLPSLSAPAVIVSEGVLVYLSPAELSDLAHSLARIGEPLVWLADVVSVSSAQAMQTLVHRAATSLQLSGLDSLAVFESAGWIVRDYRPLPVSRQRIAYRGSGPASHSVVDGVLMLTR